MNMLRRATITVALVALLALVGCATSPRAQLVRATVTYNTVAAHVIQMYKTGELSQQDLAEIQPYSTSVSIALDNAWHAYLTGQPLSVARALNTINRALQQFIEEMRGQSHE